MIFQNMQALMDGGITYDRALDQVNDMFPGDHRHTIERAYKQEKRKREKAYKQEKRER